MAEKRVIAIVGSSSAALIAAALRQPAPNVILMESPPCKSFATAAQREQALDRACVAAVAAELGV